MKYELVWGRRPRIVIVLILVLASSACTDDEPRGREGGTTTEQATTAVVRGGELAFGLEADVRTLAPGDAALPSEVTIALGIYDPLMTYVHGKLEPFLARSIDSNDDLSEYVITLRDGVTFHDGTPLNADAVVRHFDRLKDPLTKCSCFAAVAQITSMETPDGPNGLTVEFGLRAPNVAFPEVLAGSSGFIESAAAAAAGVDFAIDGVGTGPFELESYAAGERAVLVANPGYWGADENGNQLPYLDKITFIPNAGSDQVLHALETGDLDIVQAAESKVIKQAEQAGFATEKTSSSSSLMILMNNSKPPFDDVRARRALAHALDRDRINERAYDGVGVPSYSSFGPDSAYFNPDAGSPTYDRDKAAALVEEVGGLEFTIDCTPTHEAAVVLPIVEQLGREVGMTVTVETQDERAYVDRMYSKRGEYEAACLRSPHFVEPDALRAGLMTGAPGNLVFYGNEEVDQLLEEARQTIDFDTRKVRYDRVQEILASEVPFLTLVYDVSVHVYDPHRVAPPSEGEPGLRGAIEPGRLSAAG